MTHTISQTTLNQAVKVYLNDYDLVIINSSAGKDSLCALFEVCRQADIQGFPKSKMIVSHQDLGEAEWEGTEDLCRQQADLFGLDMIVSKRTARDNESLLEYVQRRGMWPSSSTRYCTSDFKRDPGAKAARKVVKDADAKNILYVMGFRKEESPARSKRQEFAKHTRLSNKTRTYTEWLPIHHWSEREVWDTIKANNLPYHQAYKLGMPRLSCVFCVFSPFDALVVAGKANPELLQKYVAVEEVIGLSSQTRLQPGGCTKSHPGGL